MSLIPRNRPKKPTPTEAPPVEYETIPVKVYNVVFTMGISLPFYLEADHSVEHTETTMLIVQGEKTTEITKDKILYIEDFPGTIKRKKEPFTIVKPTEA